MWRFALVIAVAFGGLVQAKAFGQFPPLIPFAEFSASRQTAEPGQLTESTEPILADWGLSARLRENRGTAEWSNDPWGFSRAAATEERQSETDLRRLEGRFNDSGIDGISALWLGMRSKSEPTGKLKIRQVVSQELWYSKAKIDVPDMIANRAEPYSPRDWRAEETLRMSIPTMESLFVFGHFNSNADAFQYRELNAVAKTGIGVRWVPLPKGEVLVRGGRMVAYTDTNNSARMQDKSYFAVEVLATMPLIGPFQLEYTGAALAGTLPADQNQINQDLRIALPIRNNSEFYFGAKQRMDYATPQSPWSNTRQIYLGVEFKH